MDYSPGQIVRIKCENILTYQSIEIFPCPKLNMIIGANGTGKSTIVSAIILGLGGNAAVVGRAQDLKQYVKVGERRANIEIELHNPVGEGNVTIERHFTVKGDSRFAFNGNTIGVEKLEKIVRRFNIQIDNLCQILPQEKLELFAKMNDQDRLSGTLRTIGDQELSIKLEFLKNAKEQEKEIHRKIASLKDRLVELNTKRDNMEIEVKTYKEKLFLMECLKLLKQRREWQFYFHLKQVLNMIEDSLKSKQAACKKLADVLKSTAADVRESSKKVEHAKDGAKETNDRVTTIVRDIKKRQNDITTTTDRINDVKSTFRQVEMRAKNQENEMKVLQEKIDKTKNDIMNVSEVDRELNELKSALKTREHETCEIETQKEKLRYTLEDVKNQQNAIGFKLKKLNDVSEQKMRILQDNFEDCHKGVKWLEDNRHKFRGEVFGPMFLYLNVEDNQYAKYVEASINHRELIAFICERREDTTTLMQELREKRKLKVSIVSAKDNVRPGDMRPPYPIEQLKPLGFHTYVNSLISGPRIIVEYLTLECNLHRIPIGDAYTFEVSHKVPSDIRVFFTDKYRFQCMVVSYTGEKIESSREITPARYLSSNSNSTSALEGLQARHTDCEHQLQRLNEERRKLEEKIAAGDNDSRALRGQIKELESKKHAQGRLHETLQSRQRDLRKLQNAKVDLNTERTKSNLEVKVLLAKVTNKYIELASAFKTLFASFIQYQQDKVNVDLIEKIHSKNLNSTMEFVRALLKEAGQLRELERQKRRLSKITKMCFTHAMRCTGRVDPRSPKFKQRGMFFKLTANIAVLTKLVNVYTAKVQCIGGGDGSFDIFKEYRATVKEVAQCEKKIESKESILQKHFSTIDTTKQQFLVDVKQLIATIDRNFRKFFEMMGCVGTVCLYEGEEGEDDFKKYGIHIKVKFRKEGELHILNSQIQSGGERAVSIAIYLLSLQELTTVPFRCIDEINQGMDADNERRIFNLITQSTEERGNTQYFLLTPKLLPNLNFTPSCKIFFPYNGIGSMPHAKYSQIVERRRSTQGTATAGPSTSFTQ